jgi:hypothetical protein
LQQPRGDRGSNRSSRNIVLQNFLPELQQFSRNSATSLRTTKV